MQQAFKPGSEIDLDFAAQDGERRTFPSLVLEAGPETLTLHAPAGTDGSVELSEGTEVTLWRYKGNATYVATVTIVRHQAGDPPVLITTAPSNTQELSRRTYYRVATELPFRAGRLTGQVRNISGSGALIAVPPGSLDDGMMRLAEIDVPGITQPVRVKARAVRVVRGDGEDLVGMSFELIDDRTVEQIVRYVFQRQRELIRLGELGFPWRRWR